MSSVHFEPAEALRGQLAVPADKSISHRGLLLGAFGDGASRLRGCLDAADTRSTIAAISSLGAAVETSTDPSGGLSVEIGGFGLKGASSCEVDVGNSGTLIRLLSGLLAGQPSGDWSLAGDESIATRPMGRVVEPLSELGAAITCSDGGLPPVEIHGAQLDSGQIGLGVPSAQVKSAILLAGLNASGPVSVTEPVVSRNHTELMLRSCGVTVESEGTTTTVSPVNRIEPLDMVIPGDISSAAFALTAALLIPESDLHLTNVGLNETRTGIIAIAEAMGANAAIEAEAESVSAGEPVGDLRVGSAQSLSGISVGADAVPSSIDELPLVALMGCFADGETVLTGAEELRVKETDRIAGVVEGLRGLGAEIEERDDGFRVQGTGELAGGVIDARGDHRLAMLGAVAGLVSRDGVTVEGFEAVEISYPGFEADIRSLVP